MVKLYQNLNEPDYISISQCFVHLNDPLSAAKLLKDLISRCDDVCSFFLLISNCLIIIYLIV